MLVRMVADLAMCPPGSTGRALIATKSGKTTMLSDKAKRWKGLQPGKPFGGIWLKGEQSAFGADHDIRPLHPIFNQRQNMRVFASIHRWSRFQGLVLGRLQGLVLGRLQGLVLGRLQALQPHFES